VGEKASTKDLTSIVNCQVHVLSSLALSVQLDEALRAKEVYAILAEDRGVVMLAFEAYKAIDHPLQVISEIRSGSIKCVHV